MTTSVNANDPPVKRTRRLLLKAFTSLVQEGHGVHPISVQAIAERAAVNRATFYAHFDNKFALLDTWARAKFRREVQSQLPPSSSVNMDTLRLLILIVFDFQDMYRHYVKPVDEQFEPLFEIAMQQELQEILVTWLNQVPSQVAVDQDKRNTTASIISWAIFGPAVQWSRKAESCSAEEMVDQVLTIVVAA